ncbi:MAG: hypothetical protein ABFD07_10015 [Methanobacterium sp.]|jgi:hypothetical protein
MDNVVSASTQVHKRKVKIQNDICIGINLEPSVEMFVLTLTAYQYGIIPRRTDNGFEIYQVR